MLAGSEGLSSFSIDDVEAARDFYAGTLGLEVVEEHGMLRIKLGTGPWVLAYPKDDHVPATYTVIMFPVSDLPTEVAALTAAGVRFEMLPGVGPDGIMPGDGRGPDNSWFKDPAGNWLSVMESPSAN
ncbi:MAG TPA: VOC family protein [Demequina sp.]|nr:VOC family protein [Demequina sp.]